MLGMNTYALVTGLITLALAVPAFWLTLRYNMHMFQLNVYINAEQRAWLAKNKRLQWVLKWAIGLGVVRILLGLWSALHTGLLLALDILIWITLLTIILVYRVMKEMNQKKKLVFTPRVKRMVTTIIVLSVILAGLGVGFSFAGTGLLNGCLVFIVGSQIWMQMLANTINHPIEVGVNNHYINDAKRILKGMPNLTIIGVTGSYGKTSVKFFLGTLLQQKYSTLVTPESYNTPMGVVKTIRGQMKSSHEIFVCEMGARYVGEIKEICDIVHPQHGIITSIGPQHLDTFGSLENIKKTKFELADALPDDAMLFLNGDNSYIREELASHAKVVDDVTLYHSEKIGDGYYASDIVLSSLGTSFTVTAPNGETERFNMKLIGSYNVINVMGAIAVAHRLGISLAELRVPVRRLRPVKHRMEMKEHGNVTIIDDAFNSNPVGSKAAVETLALFEGERILVTPGMVELGEDEDEYNRKFGTYAADCCDWILLVGEKHTKPILDGVLSKGFPEKKVVVFDKVEDAINFAYGIKAQGEDGTEVHKYILLENDLPDNY